MVCESRHQHTEAYCRRRRRRITHTTTHVAGDGIGGLFIQPHTLQETAQEGYSYNYTRCRRWRRRITYTTTHVAGDDAGGLFIQPHTLQETTQEGYSYSHTRCNCRFLLSSRPHPFSGAIHPFPRPFLPTARSVAAAMQYVPRPRLMCTTAAVRPYCGRRTPAQQERRNKKYIKKGAS